MTDLDWAWLVGLPEVEGCLTIRRAAPGKGRDRAVVTLCTTDEDVVRRAAALMGVRVNRYHTPSQQARGQKPVFHATATGPHATALMTALRPLLGSRRQARIAEVLALAAKETDAEVS